MVQRELSRHLCLSLLLWVITPLCSAGNKNACIPHSNAYIHRILALIKQNISYETKHWTNTIYNRQNLFILRYHNILINSTYASTPRFWLPLGAHFNVQNALTIFQPYDWYIHVLYTRIPWQSFLRYLCCCSIQYIDRKMIIFRYLQGSMAWNWKAPYIFHWLNGTVI